MSMRFFLFFQMQAALVGGGGARIDDRRRLEDDQREIQVGREGGGVDDERGGAEAQDPLLARHADRAGEAAAGGRADANRTQGLRTLKPSVPIPRCTLGGH